ncbi:hypothetical protein D3C80_1302540 [compost metagenome]
MRQHVQIVMRQLVAQNIRAILRTEDTNPNGCRGDYFTVKLLVLFQALSIALRRDENFTLIHARQHEQRDPHQHIQQDGVKDEHPNAFQHHINGHGVDNAQ